MGNVPDDKNKTLKLKTEIDPAGYHTETSRALPWVHEDMFSISFRPSVVPVRARVSFCL
jgi:hypothetical protein